MFFFDAANRPLVCQSKRSSATATTVKLKLGGGGSLSARVQLERSWSNNSTARALVVDTVGSLASRQVQPTESDS